MSLARAKQRVFGTGVTCNVFSEEALIKTLYIAEKPSVAQEFARALGVRGARRDGYLESEDTVVTWCVGHLVTMSYPEAYDPALKKWTLETLPFLPEKFRYEVIPDVAKQFAVVSGLLARPDVGTIYVCTDSGREGEYIYRLVEMLSDVSVRSKDRRRVWIDSFTDEEIARGIREAKPLSAYDRLSDAAYLRAKEDYLMGINFSRILTLKYGNNMTAFLGGKWTVVSVGRVMTCVLGMVVKREREIRNFVKKPFYRVIGVFGGIEAEWRAVPGSEYCLGVASDKKPADAGRKSSGGEASSKASEEGESGLILSPLLYKENGFHRREDAEELIRKLREVTPQEGIVSAISRKKEKKNPPLLYNLAELQNDCSKMFKISPDQTLSIAQELYEKKMTTYPRTDARVLSTAVAKVIDRNIKGLEHFPPVQAFAGEILEGEAWKTIGSSRYTNDKAITDHYAIIPTGAGLSAYNSLSATAKRVYETICRRFLSIFYPPAVYEKTAITIMLGRESFFANYRVLVDPGYLKVLGIPKNRPRSEESGMKPSEVAAGRDGAKTGAAGAGNAQAGDSGSLPDPPEAGSGNSRTGSPAGEEGAALSGGARSPGGGSPASSAEDGEGGEPSAAVSERIAKLRKGSRLPVEDLFVKEGETSPPKRYTSGSIILAMENAGQLIEDESLREMIRGSGIGTSATRAEILKKLVKIGYLHLNAKTQVITPELLGEMVCDTVSVSIRPLLSPELTASWEKGLTGVADGTISEEEYMEKLTGFVRRRTDAVKTLGNQSLLRAAYQEAAKYYAKPAANPQGRGRASASSARRKTGRKT